MKKAPLSNKHLLLQYSSLAFQLLVAVGLAVYAGFYFDKWIKTKFPIFLWLLPLAVIIAVIIKAVKDTSKKQ